MTQQKSERIMNLTICLLLARRFVDKARIREVVEGYHGLGDAAFERTFERDKDELRLMGVAVETGSNDVLFPDEVGYRIRREAFELPAIEFTAAETAALGLAASVWESATQAGQAVSALAKLRAAGIDPDPSRLAGLAPRLGAHESAFAGIWEAHTDRVPISFRYRGEIRRVEPWAMNCRRGSWYLLAHDRDRAGARIFKLARIDSAVTRIGKPGSYALPSSAEIEAHWQRLEPAGVDDVALLAIRDGRAADLRQRGTAQAVDAPAGYSAYQVSFARSGDFVADVAAYGPDVIVLGPADLRAAVITHLAAVAGLASL
ncbi:MAG TPA: DNA-binding transcriptional regulator [Propionibacteriaceae bacterium]|nr:DNA-binding transcriptional regulator [Propionibacteriaceae bacterium]